MKKVLLALAVSGLAAWQVSAALDGSSAAYSLNTDGGYNGDGTPNPGAVISSGTTTWFDSTRYPQYSAASPGGENNLFWFPEGNGVSYTAELMTTFIAPANGTYSFGTYSDDGSALYIDGTLVVNNGSDHGPQDDFNTASLTAGTHTLLSTFRENGVGTANFTVYADRALEPASAPESSAGLTGAFGLTAALCLLAARGRN